MMSPPASEKDRINPVVFYTSAGLILTFSLITILFSSEAANWILRAVNWVSEAFGWYYMLAATLYIVFVVYISPVPVLAPLNSGLSSRNRNSAY